MNAEVTLQTPATRPKRRKMLIVACVLVCAIMGAGYCAYVAVRTADFYEYVKTNRRGWEGKVHQADPELGYRPVAGARGAHLFPVGPKIPMRFDESRFRIPVDAPAVSSQQRPLVLALGCSFTYGDACRAEDAYPFRVGESLEATVLNAGVCGYGLAQMSVLGRRLIPQYRPDYVLVQYSGWLVSRSLQRYAPSYYGVVPTPYFAESPTRALMVYPAVFPTVTFDLPTSTFRASERGVADFVRFLWKMGIPLYVHDDFHVLACRVKSCIGVLPPPMTDRKRVLHTVYTELAEICAEQGSTMVVVTIGDGNRQRADEVQLVREIPNVVVVDTDAVLKGRLADTADGDYWRAYCYWRDTPPTCVDSHPNPLAHDIIARSVVSAIRNPSRNTRLSLAGGG